VQIYEKFRIKDIFVPNIFKDFKDAEKQKHTLRKIMMGKRGAHILNLMFMTK